MDLGVDWNTTACSWSMNVANDYNPTLPNSLFESLQPEDFDDDMDTSTIINTSPSPSLPFLPTPSAQELPHDATGKLRQVYIGDMRQGRSSCNVIQGTREGDARQKMRGGGGGGGGGGGDFHPCARGGVHQARRGSQNPSTLIGPEGLGDEETANDNEDTESISDRRGPVAETAILSDLAMSIVSAIAAVARDCLVKPAQSRIVSNVHEVVRALQDSGTEPEPETSQGRMGLLVQLVRRCGKTEVVEACAQLQYWLSVLAFACLMNR